MKATIYTVAKASGVSPSTVANFFNKKNKMSEKTKLRIAESARKLNYRPQQAASKKTVSIVARDIDDIDLENGIGSFLASLVQTIMIKLMKEDIQIRICKSIDDELLCHSLSSVVISFPWNRSEEEIKFIENLEIPSITINTRISGSHSICSDHYAAAKDATNHLVNKGHKRVGILVDSLTTWGFQERYRGYQDALSENGVKPDANLLINLHDQRPLVEHIIEFMKHEPTALFISSEYWGLRVQYVLDMLNKRIPEDLSIVSTELDLVSRWLSPPQNTIKQDFTQIANQTVLLIKKIINGGQNEIENILVPNKFIERNSVVIRGRK